MSIEGFFVCWLLCLCLFVGFFLFLLVGVATPFTATIDDDGSLWCLLEPHGCFALIFCCYLQFEKKVGVCVEFGFLGLKNERVFNMESRDLG